MFKRQVIIAGVRDVDYADLRRSIAEGAMIGSVRFGIEERKYTYRQRVLLGLFEDVTNTFDVIVTAISETNKGTVDDFCDFFLFKFVERPTAPEFYGDHVQSYRMRVYNWCRSQGAHNP